MINYKIIEKAEPGIPGGGVKKFYATPVLEKEITLEMLIKKISRSCTLTGADVHAVIYAMVEEITDSIANGHIVRLGGLGSMRITLNSDGKSSASEVNNSCIKKAGVIFTPGSKIKEMLSSATFSKE